jgi:hypothetical protein
VLRAAAVTGVAIDQVAEPPSLGLFRREQKTEGSSCWLSRDVNQPVT